MKFMVITKATKDSEAGVPPTTEQMMEGMKFNEESVKAGVLLAAEGVWPSSKGARVRVSGTKRTVIDGPFTETKELIAGFFIIQVKSKEEAIEWAKRMPNVTREDHELEILQVFAEEDVAASFAPEVSEQLGRIHELAAEKAAERGDPEAAAALAREAQENKRHAQRAGTR
jgi:hypothetical protein